MVTLRDKWEEREATIKRLKWGGGPSEIEKVHQQGKLTARERIEKLLDQGSFQEIDLWSPAYKTGFDIDEVEAPGDAVIVGQGEINGRPVFVWAQDATVLGGTMAENHIRKIVTVMEKALKERRPIIGMYDSEGMRIQNLVHAHSHFTPGLMMRFQTLSSGVIPQVSLVMGPCVGPAALSAVLTDFVFMVRGTSYMHVAPPPPLVTGREIGDAKMHSARSGCCSVLARDEGDCLEKCRELISFLPSNNGERPPIVETGDDPDRVMEDILEVVPADLSKWFDTREVIKRAADNGYYFEVNRDYARNLSVGFARFNGQTAGIIANNSGWKGGCEDTDSSDKHARFTRFCDAFNIPIVYFADCPAFLPSAVEERKGILRHGTMVIHATSEATVPKINIILRKLYGGAQLVMPVNFTKADRYLAWPSVERGVMGAPALASVVYLGQIKRAKTPEEAAEIKRKGTEVMEVQVQRFSSETNEDIIDPRLTRQAIIRALKSTADKKEGRPPRKHENINL